jgi:hypothetical protein
VTAAEWRYAVYGGMAACEGGLGWWIGLVVVSLVAWRPCRICCTSLIAALPASSHACRLNVAPARATPRPA